MPDVRELKDELSELSVRRIFYEKRWKEAVETSWPSGPRFEVYMGATPGTRDLYEQPAYHPRGPKRSAAIYDATAVAAKDRLAAGIDALITPQAEIWQEMKALGLTDAGVTHDDRVWLDELTRMLFTIRYDSRSMFAQTNHMAILSMAVLGTGVFFVEEDLTVPTLPYRFKYCPLSDVYLATDANGDPTTVYRILYLSPVAASQLWGEALSTEMKTKLDDPRLRHRKYMFVHAVGKRKSSEKGRTGLRAADYYSVLFEYETAHKLTESGYPEMPFVVYWWEHPGSEAYSDSPVMNILGDIKSLQLMGKNSLEAFQQWIKPPLGLTSDMAMSGRPNLNPGAQNFGAVDPTTGRLRVMPLTTVENPSFAEGVMESRRNSIRDGLYVNLFQILVENPRMTATEAMIRANEKGDLIGPVGASMQRAHAMMTEREIGVLARQGAFRPEGPLPAPESMQGRDIGARSASPLDRMRRSGELIGTTRSLELAAQVAQFDPGIMDNYDPDLIVQLANEVNGAPQMVLRDPSEVERIRAERQQQIAAQQQMAALQQTADVAAKTVPLAGEVSGIAQQLGVGAAPEGQ